ncbi:MAG: DMT family transporter [Alphaproteobacteria bacterium]
MSNSVLYATTVLIWGTTWLGITFQLGVVPPELSVAYRFTLAGALLVLFCLARGRRLAFGWRDQAAIVLFGASMFCVNYILFYVAAGYVTSGLLAVVFSTLLWMNVLNGALFLSIPVSGRVLAGGVLGLAGMALLFWPELEGLAQSSGSALGMAVGLVATYIGSLGNILSARNQKRGLPVLESNALGTLYGGLLSAAVAWAHGAPFTFDLSPAYVASLLYLALFGTIVAFGCYFTLLGRIGADRSAYAMVLFPVVALALSTAFEGYRWTAPAVAGVVLILAGNAVALRRARPALAPDRAASPS